MTWLTLLLLLAGFVLLIGGAELLVRGAAHLAVDLGISPLVVGLTVVAFGTSAPELAVSVLSAWQGQAGIALGNVVGSNIANILLILGLSALAAPLVVARQVVRLEVPIMVGISALTLLLRRRRPDLGRAEGLLLFAGLIVYTVWTVRRSRRENRQVQEELPAEARGTSRRSTQLLQILGGLVLLGLGSKMAGRRRGDHRPPFRGQRPGHRPDRGRHRHLAAGARHLGPGQPARPARHRRRQHRRQQHLQHPLRPRPDGPVFPRTACRFPRRPSISTCR